MIMVPSGSIALTLIANRCPLNLHIQSRMISNMDPSLIPGSVLTRVPDLTLRADHDSGPRESFDLCGVPVGQLLAATSFVIRTDSGRRDGMRLGSAHLLPESLCVLPERCLPTTKILEARHQPPVFDLAV